MNFLIVTHVPHILDHDQVWAYGPYTKEINLWIENFSKITIIAPKSKKKSDKIDLKYNHNNINFVEVPSLNFTTWKNFIRSIIVLPNIFVVMFRELKSADHLHLRCPGNIGLLGSFIQIFFPKKKKTVKYAGNWDWSSKQPASYRFQQLILNSTLLSKNIRVLVYGDWNRTSRNIVPFFTATYREKDKLVVEKEDPNVKLNLLFVGTLSSGKRPDISIFVLRELLNKNIDANLIICGDGPEKENLQKIATSYGLTNAIEFKGNLPSDEVRNIYMKAHFLVFASRSEGWPKVVAEAMWWGCVPVTTSVSCVPQMLNYGERGILAKPDSIEMANGILKLLNNEIRYKLTIINGMNWSREYTLERFKKELLKILAK